MLLEMDLETMIYVTGIAVVVLQSIYLDLRMRQVHQKLDKVTHELVEFSHLELVRRKGICG
jgi:hypothetical protein